MGPGGWGVGKKLKNVAFFGPFSLDIFLSFFERSRHKRKQLTKSVKFARIELILIPPDSPHRVLDSPGGLGQFFQKIENKINFEVSEKNGEKKH